MYVHAVTVPCVSLVAIGLVGIIAPLRATAADTEQNARCVRMLRVTGVERADVLFLRSSPQVPDSSEADNRLIGIPPGARRIEELDGGQEGWQHIRYMGKEGYASTRYLVADTVDCPDALLTKTDQPGSGRDQLAPVAPADPFSLKATTEEGYLIEEGFFRVTIKGRMYLLQGLIVKRADAAGKLPIMILAHGTASSAKERREMTPRGAKRTLRAYARRGWLAVYVLRRGYGQSDGPIPVSNFKCDGISGPTFEEFSNADADDLEALLTHIGQREDADVSRVITLGISGGGAAVVALSARNIQGHQLVINVSGGVHITCGSGSGNDNRARLVEAMRHFGAKSRVPNLWYYAKTDHLFPEETVAAMRTAFLEGGGYARLTHYDKVVDYSINKDVDGHMLWSKASYNVMVDIDAYLRTRGLPTWNYNEAQTLAKKIDIEESKGLVAKLEQYLAAPDYKALVQSTIDRVRIEYGYGYPTLGQAKQATLDICHKRHPGHTCKVVDPQESAPTPPAPTPASNPNKPDAVSSEPSSSKPMSEDARAEYALIERIDTKTAWELFIQKHKAGYYVDLARERLKKLETRPTIPNNIPDPSIGAKAASKEHQDPTKAAVLPRPEHSQNANALTERAASEKADPTSKSDGSGRRYPAGDRRAQRAASKPTAAGNGRSCGYGFWEPGQTCWNNAGRMCTITSVGGGKAQKSCQ